MADDGKLLAGGNNPEYKLKMRLKCPQCGKGNEIKHTITEEDAARYNDPQTGPSAVEAYYQEGRSKAGVGACPICGDGPPMELTSFYVRRNVKIPRGFSATGGWGS